MQRGLKGRRRKASSSTCCCSLWHRFGCFCSGKIGRRLCAGAREQGGLPGVRCDNLWRRPVPCTALKARTLSRPTFATPAAQMQRRDGSVASVAKTAPPQHRCMHTCPTNTRKGRASKLISPVAVCPPAHTCLRTCTTPQAAEVSCSSCRPASTTGNGATSAGTCTWGTQKTRRRCSRAHVTGTSPARLARQQRPPPAPHRLRRLLRHRQSSQVCTVWPTTARHLLFAGERGNHRRLCVRGRSPTTTPVCLGTLGSGVRTRESQEP